MCLYPLWYRLIQSLNDCDRAVNAMTIENSLREGRTRRERK